MKTNEAIAGARGQIVWILALVLSTTAIIYLESLDIGAPGPSAPVSAGLAASATEALAAAELRYMASADARSAAALVLALVAAVQAGALDIAEGRARIAPLRAEAAQAPEWATIAVLTDLTFAE